MDYRTLGHSGIKVSALSLGSWLTYESMPEDDARAVIRAGLDAGITFLDDARYNDRTGKAPLKTGYSEMLFGRLLRDIGVSRDELAIANKLWFEFYPHESIEAELDGSLSRLQMEYLDIAYCEKPPASLLLDEMIPAIDRVIDSGKLRAWGVLNWSAGMIEEAVHIADQHGCRRPTAAQLAYSVVMRSPVEDQPMVDVCRDAGIAVVSSYSLSGGLLSGKYRGGDAVGGRLAAHLGDARLQPLLPKIEPFMDIAENLACSPSQLAIGYCLKNPRVASVLFGSRSVAQLRENLGALAVLPRLTEEVMASLRAL
jgi:aryl-alcohol dehydrogenase-like predicted oxidoreductase